MSAALQKRERPKYSGTAGRSTNWDMCRSVRSTAFPHVQKYVKHKTLNEMLQELPDVGQFILAMDTWFEKLMEK